MQRWAVHFHISPYHKAPVSLHQPPVPTTALSLPFFLVLPHKIQRSFPFHQPPTQSSCSPPCSLNFLTVPLVPGFLQAVLCSFSAVPSLLLRSSGAQQRRVLRLAGSCCALISQQLSTFKWSRELLNIPCSFSLGAHAAFPLPFLALAALFHRNSRRVIIY